MRALLFSFLLCASLQTFALRAVAHNGEESRVVIELDDQHAQPAGPLLTKFQLVDTVKNITLSEKDLTLTKDHTLQIFIFDPALHIFQHLDAAFKNGTWSCQTTLQTNGNYWFWTEGTLVADQTPFSANTRIEVTNGLPANSTPPVLSDARANSASGTLVELGSDKITAKVLTVLSLRFSHSDATPVQLGAFRGALAAMTIVSDDGDFITHAKFASRPSPSELSVQLNLPNAGNYRTWLEFVENGLTKTAELSFEVF
jgi:hypothetical protein